MLVLLVVLLNFAQLSEAAPIAPIPITPDPQMTPGARCSVDDRDFDGYRYQEKMPHCFRRVNGQLKKRIHEAYNIPKGCRGSYTVDHLIPLSMGGNNSPENLWPEHHRVKATRQRMEDELFFQVEMGALTSEEAVSILLKEKRELVLDLTQLEGCG